MSHTDVYQARLRPPAGDDDPWWEIDVLGVGVTAAATLEDCRYMAADLVATMLEVDIDSVGIEFIR